MFHRIAILRPAYLPGRLQHGSAIAISATWPTGPAYKDVMEKPADKAIADTSWQEFLKKTTQVETIKAGRLTLPVPIGAAFF